MSSLSPFKIHHGVLISHPSFVSLVLAAQHSFVLQGLYVAAACATVIFSSLSNTTSYVSKTERRLVRCDHR